MGKVFQKYLDGSRVYCCSTCKVHLSMKDDVISKNFHGRHGKAYLFNKAVNVSLGPNEERTLITGLHVVCDIYCNLCHTILGWKYEEAYEESQKYKVGKFILEKMKLKTIKDSDANDYDDSEDDGDL
ncbi:hypothetical protein AKO1_015860 [Acrasis kona]|uniref:Protein yippee-like n=1 Tax=Acrasis kona TaxID=1008807 RepID=A0AAW2ZG13_9EUKA